ncbi:MAG: deoxyribodipyrimidine photo-lyase [Planctomycetes bacterium]|nr:deoxyribodipyrimidine photo-lyase [Planctomycetota bacterium]
MNFLTIVWFRHDLRLADNPALAAALERRGQILPVFIWSPEEEGRWTPGTASRWWLHHSLSSLSKNLQALHAPLVIRRGPALEALNQLIDETRATAVVWNRRYEPAAIARDKQIKQAFRERGIDAESYNGSLLYEPWDVATKTGQPYQVFAPFWKACTAREAPTEPLDAPEYLPGLRTKVAGEPLECLGLLPKLDWDAGMREHWTPGEAGAHARLKQFTDRALGEYHELRNRPDLEGSSQLSPYLHFGEISPRQVWHLVDQFRRVHRTPTVQQATKTFLAEIGWREFAHHLLYHFPHTINAPLREKFTRFAWEQDATGLKHWQRGQTGYPIVDAGMRQLWQWGWMHNRVRMIVASFLVKDLLISWHAGAEWFWDTLVDADLANNTLGWQWTAGCGADAAPFFRIFNPVSQGQKFDVDGEYVRRWVPELARLPTEHIHAPWEAPADVLAAAGVRLGQDYPRPLVDHALARTRALERLAAIKDG